MGLSLSVHSVQGTFSLHRKLPHCWTQPIARALLYWMAALRAGHSPFTRRNSGPSRSSLFAIATLIPVGGILLHIFRMPPYISAFGTNPSLLETLKNTRTDGIGALCREGTAAFLNSMVCTKYALTPQLVTSAFAAAIASDKATAAQAELFKKANVFGSVWQS